ncbi:MAG: hypothetical protein ACI84C_000494 [Flavobacteriales bacterium]|jgi:uncharacterized protein YecE (DUF72 family)
MKFGKLDDIEGIDFGLPLIHPSTGKVLSKSKRANTPEIYTGGTMWTLKNWKGKVYPEKTPQKDFAKAYCQQFGTIELNATHYRIHPPETIRKWYDLAPEGFRFCPKFPNLITHYRQFLNCDGITDEFLTAIVEFQEKLGPCFMQLPPRMATTQANKIQKYLQSLPNDIKIHLEFRHESWFENTPEATDTWDLLEELGIGSVITDTAGRRDAVHMRLTSDTLILRFGGNELHPSDYVRMDEWTVQIGKWIKEGLSEVYIWMHQPESILSPESLIYFGEKLQKETGLLVKSPVIL